MWRCLIVEDDADNARYIAEGFRSLGHVAVISRDGTPAANPFYQVAWTFNTNMAMEVIVPSLARFLGVATAAKTFLLFSQLLLVGGATALERVVKGRVEVALFASMTNIVSGFMITDRMLKMFKKQ